jgi:aryl-alcohol dehydrogenase-like predicted oxidoreductase
MKTRTLGKGGLEVSAVGIGCMGLSRAFGPPTPHDEAVRIIREAYEIGYTIFDTAGQHHPAVRAGAASG